MRVIKEAQSNLLKIGKKYFYAGDEDKKGNTIFKEVSKGNKEKIDLLTKQIIPKLRASVSVDDLLVGALAKLPLVELVGIHKRLFADKRKAKPKVKKGCLYIKVGKHRVDLQD